MGDLGDLPPVDPLNPDKEVDPENPPELSENQGLLGIDFVSRFNFGYKTISANNESYFAKPQYLLDSDGTVLENEEHPNYVQISDRPKGYRGG
ncbi:WxL domain-containing protein [Enterococcus sp. S52]|nr:WxL domain-containing protein [Enterococcus sp. S52]MBK0070380.1 WxL domain-containing protein [Enterococcus sp. S53]MBK0141220.1 WxL domain-containing protein [Enterococcus sp. S76]MBK0144608.1 WxL domain-containing protein [Enterococcus sp. S77]